MLLELGDRLDDLLDANNEELWPILHRQGSYSCFDRDARAKARVGRGVAHRDYWLPWTHDPFHESAPEHGFCARTAMITSKLGSQ